MRGLLSVLALLAGCQFDGGLGSGLLCPTGECPAGETCVDGRCSAQAGGTDGAIADGATGDAAVAIDGMATNSPNLVSNPGMEEGIDPWTPFNSTLDPSTEEHGGTASLLVCAESSGDFTVYQDVIKTPAPIPKDQSYTASIWVRAVGPGTPPASMKLTIRESGGGVERGDHDGAAVPGLGDSWVQLEASGTVQQDDRENLILIVWGLDGAETACFAADDAVLRAD